MAALLGSVANFQPLMGNGNCKHERQHVWTLSLPTPHGEREQADSAACITFSDLPTPHGERELIRFPAGASIPNFFQPLMGNGNAGLGNLCANLISASNPSWGTGTADGLLCVRRELHLPTPHGERERSCISSVISRCGIFQPLMGNGNPTAAANLE